MKKTRSTEARIMGVLVRQTAGCPCPDCAACTGSAGRRSTLSRRGGTDGVDGEHDGSLQYEWLDLYNFETIEEVQQIATEWLWSNNNERPNMGIDGVTPAMQLKMAA